MSNDNQASNKPSTVVDDEVRIYVEAEPNSQDPAKDNGSLKRFFDGLREHPLEKRVADEKRDDDQDRQ
jgi:hypothetical protein